MRKSILLGLSLMMTGMATQAQGNFAIEQSNGFELQLQDSQFNFDNTTGSWQVAGTSVNATDIKRIARAAQSPIQLAAKGVTNHSVEASVWNQSGQPYYYVQVAEIDTLKTYNTPELLYQSNYKLWKSWADLYYMDVKDYVKAYGMVQQADITDSHVTSLKANTEYCLYAYGLNDDIEMATPVTYMTFTTGPVVPVEVSFDLQANVRGKKVDVTVTPSDNEVAYYYDVIEDRQLDGYGQATIEEGIAAYITHFVAFAGQGTEEFYKNMCRKGVQQRTWDYLTINTHHYLFAVAMDAGMNMCSPLAITEFTTGDILPSDNVIDVDIKVAQNNAFVNITPSNKDRYIAVLLNPEEVEGKTDAELVEYLETTKTQSPNHLNMTYGLNEPWMIQANQRLNVQSGGTYYAVVFGYEMESLSYTAQGVVTTDIQRIPFTLLTQPLPAADQEYYFKTEVYDGDGIAVGAMPLEKNINSYYGFAPASASDDDIIAAIQAKADAAGMGLAEYMNSKASKQGSVLMLLLPDGPSMEYITGGEDVSAEVLEEYGVSLIEPDTEYRVYAVSLNDDGTMAQDFRYTQVLSVKAQATTPVTAPRKTLVDRVKALKK